MLNLTSKHPSLVWVNRATEMSRVRQGASTDRRVSGKWLRLLASYKTLPKQLLGGILSVTVWTKRKDIIQPPTLILETCELFTMTDGG